MELLVYLALKCGCVCKIGIFLIISLKLNLVDPRDRKLINKSEGTSRCLENREWGVEILSRVGTATKS